MKNKKIILIIALVILLGITLCLFLKKGNENKRIMDSYNKSKKGDEVYSYTVDLRIYGILKDQKINKIAIINYLEDNQISINFTDTDESKATDYVLKDGKFYKNKDNKLAITNSFKSYYDPEIFMQGVESLVTSKEVRTEKIGDIDYKIFEVEFDKEFVNKMLKTTDIKYNVKDNIKGEIWLDGDSRIYRVYYNITDKLTVFASYYKYNSTVDLNEVVK